MKSDTLNSFDTTMFGTKQTLAARIGSDKSFHLTTLNLSSRANLFIIVHGTNKFIIKGPFRYQIYSN
jgi:hypothetical protein